MAPRRERRDRSGEMVFADVAMAALGPIALLMVLFMILAGSTADRPDCDALSAPQIALRVEGMRSWIAEIEGIIALRKERLAEDCPEAVPDLDRVQPATTVPELLAGLCRSDRDRVLVRLDHDFGEIKRLMGLRDVLNQATEACLGPITQQTCESFDPSRHAQQKAALGAWIGILRQDINRFRRQLEDRCTNLARPRSRQDSVPALLPDPLGQLCRTDQDLMLEAVGVNRRSLREMLAKREALAAALAECVGNFEAPEQPTTRVVQIEFATCATDFVDQGRDLSGSKIRDRFDALAVEVIGDLGHADYNRIDIFGHTDERPISGRCSNGASSNRELSALRAMRFADELERALRDADPAVARRLDSGDLRVYSIGVGEKEPARKPDGLDDPDRWQKDRRIELRYVTDLFTAKGP